MRRSIQGWRSGALQRLGRLSLAQRFMLASLMILVAGMAGVGSWVANRIESGVIHRTSATTALYVDSVVAPHLQELAISDSLSADQTSQLDGLLHNTALGEQIAAFKVWGPGGRVLYSTEPSVVGRVYPIHPRLRAAWLGEVSAGISDLDDAENEMERQSDDTPRLLEIYTPVRLRGTDQVIAVAEFYQQTAGLDAELRSAKQRSWLIVGGATLVMYLLLAGFVQRASNIIIQQQRELATQVDQLTDVLRQNERLHDRVRRAAGRTTALNERFLRRFSAELHDGPVQDLSLAVLELDNLIVTCAATPDAAAYVPRLEAIEQTVRRGLQDVRSTSAGLLLPHLGQLSVADTARHAARAHERRSKVPVTLELEHAPERAGLATKISVYRVIQEALTNAARHAPGAAPHVRVAGDDGQLTVSIADAGSGFDAANMLASDEHLGLVGMRERVESLGGTLCIESAAQAGTTVLARLPLEPDVDEAGFVQSREVAHG